jgi:hypothetical protein
MPHVAIKIVTNFNSILDARNLGKHLPSQCGLVVISI